MGRPQLLPPLTPLESCWLLLPFFLCGKPLLSPSRPPFCAPLAALIPTLQGPWRDLLHLGRLVAPFGQQTPIGVLLLSSFCLSHTL